MPDSDPTNTHVGPVIEGLDVSVRDALNNSPPIVMALDLGPRLAKARTKQGVTQKALAQVLGKKSRATVAQYENNEITPPLPVIVQLAKALSIDPAYLAFGARVADYDKDGSDTIFGFDLAAKLGLEPSVGSIVELAADASAFGLTRGDLLVVDTSRTQIQGDGRMYAVQTPAGDLNLVRTEIALEEVAGLLRVTFGQGQLSDINPEKVHVVGCVKATIKPQ